jgi:hypothetical protein
MTTPIPSQPLRGGRALTAVQWMSTLGAGGLGFLAAYLEWRGVIGVPMAMPHPGISLDPAAVPRVIPWAPWWVLPPFIAVLAMLLWRRTGVLSGRVRWLRAAIAMALSAAAAMPLAYIVLHLSTLVRMDPFPGWLAILLYLPELIGSALGFGAMILAWHGIVTVPVSALCGLVLAAMTRIAMRWVPNHSPASTG